MFLCKTRFDVLNFRAVFPRTRQHMLPLLALVLPVALLMTACGTSTEKFATSASAAPAKSAAQGHATPKTASSDPMSLSEGLGVSGSQVSILQPDPKRPGKFLFKIWATGVTGASLPGTVQGTLSNVTAFLYQAGISTARMQAPRAFADSTKQSVVGSGGVRVWSLTQPGTTLSADKVTWLAQRNTVEAVGHVVYRSGKTGLTIHVPRMTADTALKTFSSAGAGNLVLPPQK